MKNDLPPIDSFLKEVDPQLDDKINTVILEIVAVNFLQAVEVAKADLGNSDLDQLDEYLKSEPKIKPERIIEFFNKAGRSDHLLQITKEVTEKNHLSYLRLHMSNLSGEKKQKLYLKFPQLMNLDKEER